MPAEKNTVARILVPIAVLLVAAVVVIAVGVNSSRSTPPPAAPAAPATAPAGDQSPATTEQPAEPAPLESPAAEPAPALPAPVGLRARVADAPAVFDPIGSLDPDGDWMFEIRFAAAGAGVESVTLSQYYTDTTKAEHYAVQRARSLQAPGVGSVAVVSLAARAAIINGRTVDLYSTLRGPLWTQAAPGVFTSIIEDEQGAAVARITKRYIIEPGSYDIRIEQALENLSPSPLTVEWVQYGAVDLPADELGYGGELRRVRFGYLLSPRLDPSRQIVETERKLHSRTSVIDKPLDQFGRIWPTERAADESLELVWVAMTNRYFTFVTHPLVPRDAAAAGAPIDKVFDLARERIDRIVVTGVGAEPAVILQIRGGERAVEPGASLDLSFAAYTGPKYRKILNKDPTLESLGINKLIVFNFGGPCAFCTFQPLARGLFYFLGFFHDILFRDWALAIMFLVVCVRGVLHPVTKRSQISVQRFSKQMQALAPKQKKLQEKYKDDPKKLREEMARLMREENINFTGALGCLPMFLQSPIWIALYAMLFFAFDLRHQPAFFGVFQSITGGAWSFLGDLSAPDRLIEFGAGFGVPLMGRISSFNILPLVLGAVFYVHQKYLTPPPSASMTPEQQSQQKIMKVMMVVLFPVLMYNAPSGLSIYFITNSALGIIESRYIRAHIDQMDLEPKKPSPVRKKVENLRAPRGKRPPTFKDRKK